MFLRIVVFVPLIFFSVACSQGSKGVRQELDELDGSVETIRGRQAEQAAEIGAIRDDLRKIAGRLDELEHINTTRFGSELGALRREVGDLKLRTPPPPGVPNVELTDDEYFAANLPAHEAKILIDALAKIREGSFSLAVPALLSMFENGYDRPYTPNLFFWLGVCYDGNGEYRKAVGAYNDLVTRYPKHQRAPHALLRQAESLFKLGDRETSALVFRKLVKDFPKSTEADQAKAKLKKL
ncbi:MAG TPA: tetratricopeptide repeat protein [Oligoflexia bacterium]|nr:tetratricopeptide repeat protein [Oligoflexia bacterium]HMP27819.1 tetratricopeptide repeat protein [Oligoflexia bacterium]